LRVRLVIRPMCWRAGVQRAQRRGDYHACCCAIAATGAATCALPGVPEGGDWVCPSCAAAAPAPAPAPPAPAPPASISPPAPCISSGRLPTMRRAG
jgi:hypothetical protein